MTDRVSHVGEILGDFEVTGETLRHFRSADQWQCIARCTRCGHVVTATALALASGRCQQCRKADVLAGMRARIGEVVQGREIVDAIRTEGKHQVYVYVVRCLSCGRVTTPDRWRLDRPCACMSETRITPGDNLDPRHIYTRGRKLNRNSTSGCRGVSKMAETGKWRATITVDRRSIHLGTFDEFEDAVRARRAAERQYFDERLPEAEYDAQIPAGYIPVSEWAEMRGHSVKAARYHAERGHIRVLRVGIGEYIDKTTPWPGRKPGGKKKEE